MGVWSWASANYGMKASAYIDKVNIPCVPIDLSVIGYDNLNLCQYTVPKLTSVSQNVPKKARLATELLLKKIHDNESDSNLGEIMDVEIVDRQSVISLY